MTLPALRSSGRPAGFRGALLLLAAVCLAVPARSQAQVPAKFTNLRVLPKNISRRRLLETMHGFTEALGVGCSGCHARQKGDPRRLDFPSDKKWMKRDARVMLRMVETINRTILPKLPRRGTPRVSVTCMTCHRGRRRPEPLDQILAEAIRTQGMDSAVARYRELRARYYGTAAYDFSDRPLIDLAERLAPGNPAGALRLLDLSVEFNPQSAPSYFLMGRIHEQRGDRQAAIQAYQKAVQLAPGFGPARARLDSLRSGG